MRLATQFEACFDEDHTPAEAKQVALCPESQAAHWDADERIDWKEMIDFEDPLGYDDRFILIWGSKRWLSDIRRADLRWSYHAYTVSQFLHGEKAALLEGARLVEVLPKVSAKQCSAAQACDESRRGRIFNPLPKEETGWFYPIDDGLQTLIHQGLSESRWAMVVLTTQVLIEGLPLAALQKLRDFSKHILISNISSYVLADKARHVAFGAEMLKTSYACKSNTDFNEPREFVYDGLSALADRLNTSELWNIDDAQPSLHLLNEYLAQKVGPVLGQVVKNQVWRH